MKDPSPSPIPIRILSHNIRYATSAPFPNELPWSSRKRGLISQLRYHTRNSTSSPLICLQEVLHNQLSDILTGLNSPSPSNTSELSSDQDGGDWAYIGVGRDDGQQAGEYSPIFYRKSDYTLLSSSTTWLSLTPSKPSKSWDAASIRILTHGVFRHNLSHKIILVMNTHLDDQGAKSRVEGAKIILKVLKELVVRGRRWDVNGAVLAGDLNSEDTGEAYQVLNEKGSGLVDMRTLLPEEKDNPSGANILPRLRSATTTTTQPQSPSSTTPTEEPSRPPFQSSTGTSYYGHGFTFTGFPSPTTINSTDDSDDAPKRIDFIHLETASLVHEKEAKWNMDSSGKNDSPWQVEGYTVLPNGFDDGVWISDHRAVVGDLLLLK